MNQVLPLAQAQTAPRTALSHRAHFGHISEALGLRPLSHAEIPFVDTLLAKDVKLFFDPWLIAQSDSIWCRRAQPILDSYFDRFFTLYRTGAPDTQKLKLFAHCHEINSTRFGYGTGHNGKAKTPEGMLETFSSVPALFAAGVPLNHSGDLPLFIDRYAEDCLSDLFTNILFQMLNEFTLEQCLRYGKEPRPCPPGYFYWSAEDGRWREYQGPCLLVDSKPYLLVPKEMIRNRFFFGTNQFFSRIIIEGIQREQAAGGVEVPKYLLKERYRGGGSQRECIIRMTTQTPEYLSEYHRQLPQWYAGEGMTNAELDYILYGRA